MSTLGLIRLAVLAGVVSAAACQGALAQSGLPVRNIRVDVAPLRANAGDPTAAWVQQGLPDQLAHALAGRVTAQGGTLIVRIDTLTFGPIKDSYAWDNISGVATIGGVQWPVRATTRYQASAVDQTLFERSNRQRVTQLIEALTFWLARDL